MHAASAHACAPPLAVPAASKVPCGSQVNLSPPQRVMKAGGTACGRALVAGLLMSLQPEYVEAVAALERQGHDGAKIREAWVTDEHELELCQFEAQKQRAYERLTHGR